MHLFFCDAIVAEKNSFEFFISHAKTLFCYDQKMCENVSFFARRVAENRVQLNT